MDNRIVTDFINERGLHDGDRIVDAYRAEVDDQYEIDVVILITKNHVVARFTKDRAFTSLTWDMEVI